MALGDMFESCPERIPMYNLYMFNRLPPIKTTIMDSPFSELTRKFDPAMDEGSQAWKGKEGTRSPSSGYLIIHTTYAPCP